MLLVWRDTLESITYINNKLWKKLEELLTLVPSSYYFSQELETVDFSSAYALRSEWPDIDCSLESSEKLSIFLENRISKKAKLPQEFRGRIFFCYSSYDFYNNYIIINKLIFWELEKSNFFHWITRLVIYYLIKRN